MVVNPCSIKVTSGSFVVCPKKLFQSLVTMLSISWSISVHGKLQESCNLSGASLIVCRGIGTSDETKFGLESFPLMESMRKVSSGTPSVTLESRHGAGDWLLDGHLLLCSGGSLDGLHRF